MMIAARLILGVGVGLEGGTVPVYVSFKLLLCRYDSDYVGRLQKLLSDDFEATWSPSTNSISLLEKF